ncbi:hypothetical protein Cgig2_030499 [Carnegiea gigantea]|uniref:Aminotransferase-like plant mobile domain-containing protein n=1 Tax=Carnegiea gigantea TaxID=171969 RepID=A0A9Q1GUF6_9CARY|nr:hypothetical protein Cgig2_030499 [Carnegiea gigantea]
MVGAIEWTEYILKHFEHTLRSVGIFEAVGVSCYPYHFDRDVWRAFCELWGPLTNTLHYGAGEVGISLYDSERIGGLPILGDIYEEFLPPNEDLMDAKKFLPTVLELLHIHAELCRFHKSNHVYWNWWLDHFYRGELTWGAFGKESERRTPSNPPRISQKERLSTLNVTNIEELVAFLGFWLSRFALSEVIRLETFMMASLMAKGQTISLAPTMLGYIYHGLGQVASHPDHPGRANPCFPIHYLAGWLAEMFSALYSQRPDSEYLVDYPVLMRYAGMSAKRHSDAVKTAIVPMPDILDDLVEAMPIQSIPTSLASLFCNLEEDWVRESILKGVGVIIDIISNHSFAKDLLASRARIFQSLSALCSMINIYKLSIIEICWLSSKVEEIFGVVEAAAKIEELVDVDRVKALSDQDLTCSSEVVRIKGELNSLSNEAAKLKVKEQEILREEERIRKCERI